MVVSLPIPPLVYLLNLICPIFNTCKVPAPYPEIKYDFGTNNLVSVKLLRSSSHNLLYNNPYDPDYDYFNPETAPEPNVIDTGRVGKFEGYYMTTSGGRKIGAFEGIKYAEAKRWEKPVPLNLSTSGQIHQAKSPGPDCVQLNAEKLFQLFGVEDCLFLNVYTPVISGKKREDAKLPVVLVVHSGAYIFGSGREYGPSYLLNEDVLLVNFNYRLGVLGFMSTGDRVLPGNLGMYDQVLAIKWVKENIASFGGDPERITLFGYSAGAASVHLHMMSDLTKNLFRNAVSQSGDAFCTWCLNTPWRARSYTEKLASYFSCPVRDSRKLVDCLKEKDAVSLVAAQIHLVDWMPSPPGVFVPTIEYDTDNNDDEPVFLADFPENLYRQGKVAKTPWIHSVTDYEGLTVVMIWEALGNWDATRLYWKKKAKYVLDIEYLGLNNTKKVVDKVTRYYLGGKMTTRGTAFDYAKMISDRYFHFYWVKSLQAHSQIAPTYASQFTFRNGTYTLGKFALKNPEEWAASHGDDECFVFNCTLKYPGFKRSDPEYKVSKAMVDYIVNFATNGTPSFTDTPNLPEDLWEPISNPKDIRVLQIDRNIKMMNVDLKSIKFWQNLRLPDAKLWVDL